jgi:hypothetical protein
MSAFLLGRLLSLPAVAGERFRSWTRDVERSPRRIRPLADWAQFTRLRRERWTLMFGVQRLLFPTSTHHLSLVTSHLSRFTALTLQRITVPSGLLSSDL